MTTPVSRLVVQIGANVSGLVSGGRQATTALGRVDRSAMQTTQRLAAMGAAAAAAAATAMFALAQRAINVADEIGKTAKAIGTTAEELQELRYAADRAGVSSGQFDQAMTRFTRGLGEAANGTGTAKRALDQLGVSMDEIRGKSPAEALSVISDRLQGLEDPMRRNAILADLFGRSGAQMATMLGQGSHALDEMRQKARDLGVVISNEMIAKAEVAKDELSDMGDVLRVAGLNIGLEFMPVMRALAALFTSGEFQQGVRSTTEAMADMIRFMADNWETVAKFSAALFGAYKGAKLMAATRSPLAIAGGAAVGGVAGFMAADSMFGGSEGPASFDARFAGGDIQKMEADLQRRQELLSQHHERLGEIQDGANKAASEKSNQQALTRLEALRAHLRTEEETEQHQHEQRLEHLRTALDQRLISAEQYNEKREALEAKHQEKLTEIARKESDKRNQLLTREQMGMLRATSGFFNNMASLAEAGGEKSFAAQKMLALAGAAIGSIEAGLHAYTWGNKIGGPAVGAAFAATAVAAQMSRVAAIKATTSKGGGGIGGGGGGGMAAVPVAPTPPAAEMQSRSVHISLSGRSFDSEQIRELIGQINDEMRDGTKLHLNPV